MCVKVGEKYEYIDIDIDIYEKKNLDIDKMGE